MSKKDKPRTKRLTPETMIALAVESLKAEIGPHLDSDQTQQLARIVTALDIARREITTTDEGPLWALLDEIYDEGDGSTQQLVADMRSGKISDGTHPGLANKLRAMLFAELKVRNPRFLRSRGHRI